MYDTFTFCPHMHCSCSHDQCADAEQTETLTNESRLDFFQGIVLKETGAKTVSHGQ